MKNGITSILSGLFNATTCFAVLALLVLSCNEGGVGAGKLKTRTEKEPDIRSGSYSAESSSYFPEFWVEGIYDDKGSEGIKSAEKVEKQETERPLLNIVVLLKKYNSESVNESLDQGWNRLFNSGDAITSGSMNAGYNIVVSDKVLPADAYWIYTSGGEKEALPEEIVDIFDSNKPVFIQCGGSIPSGAAISEGWRRVLENCGIDGTKEFGYRMEKDSEDLQDESLPPDQTQDLPYTGYYGDTYLRFTGSDIQHGTDLRAGTIIPEDAITGTVYCKSNRTNGRGPFIVGRNGKFLVTATCLNWEVASPISDLLAGCGVKASSNVWGIAGKDVTAFIAIETTELEMTIPGLIDGSKIHVVVWEKKRNQRRL
jgi:hypothetical protein